MTDVKAVSGTAVKALKTRCLIRIHYELFQRIRKGDSPDRFKLRRKRHNDLLRVQILGDGNSKDAEVVGVVVKRRIGVADDPLVCDLHRTLPRWNVLGERP